MKEHQLGHPHVHLRNLFLSSYECHQNDIRYNIYNLSMSMSMSINLASLMCICAIPHKKVPICCCLWLVICNFRMFSNLWNLFFLEYLDSFLNFDHNYDLGWRYVNLTSYENKINLTIGYKAAIVCRTIHLLRQVSNIIQTVIWHDSAIHPT